MSLFNKFFGSDSAQTSGSSSFWKPLESEEALNDALKKSSIKKVVLFKHSTRCHISKMVLRNFEKEVNNSEKDVEYYLLDLISYRSLSNKIAQDFAVQHQSPQLLVLENGKVIKDASHQAISVSLI